MYPISLHPHHFQPQTFWLSFLTFAMLFALDAHLAFWGI